MRLLDLVTGDFAEFSSPSTAPPYAILSHRWDETEQSFQDIREIQKSCEQNREPSTATPTLRARFKLLSRSSWSPNGASSTPPSLALPQSIWDSDSGLSDKVRHACEAAREDGFRYLWIDSCCIDKTSSSELSESINSMFAWYRDAEICYAFLADVPTCSFAGLKSPDSAFRSSVWFTRGWTLQELIAPRELLFLSQTWESLGTRASLSGLVEEITGMPTSVLASRARGVAHRSLDECSVAQRMSWAAKRQTTKVEDEAYSLLGIFDIQMSPLYGEGRRAFRRLQEEILRRIPDQTIFAWGDVYPTCFTTRTVTMGRPAASKPSRVGNGSAEEIATANPPSPRTFNFYVNGTYMMFAHSPGDFAGAGNVVAIAHDVFSDVLAPLCDTSPQEYNFTPHGIRTDFPLLPLDRCLVPNEEFHQDEDGSVDWYLAVLACQRSDFPGQLLCCVCRMPAPRPPVSTLRRGYLLDAGRADPMAADAYSAIVRLSLVSDDAGHCGYSYSELHLRPHTVYLEHPARAPPLSASLARHFGTQDSEGMTTEAVTFTLPKWSRSALHTQGYAASLEPLGLPPTWDPAAAAAGGSHGGHGLLRLTLSPRTPHTASGLHRWTVVADLMYECHVDVRIFRTAVYVSGGKDVFFTVRSESTHDRWGGLGSGVVGSYYQSHRLGGIISKIHILLHGLHLACAHFADNAVQMQVFRQSIVDCLNACKVTASPAKGLHHLQKSVDFADDGAAEGGTRER